MSEDNNNIGDILRQARESKNLSLEDISNKTKISIHNLKQLEENILDAKLATYTKGHIQLYCEAIDLDSASILNNVCSDNSNELEYSETNEEQSSAIKQTLRTRIVVATSIITLAIISLCYEKTSPALQFKTSNIEVPDNKVAILGPLSIKAEANSEI
jgi:cytoskeletal protein RodZ